MIPGIIVGVSVVVNLLSWRTISRGVGRRDLQRLCLILCAALTATTIYSYFALPSDPDVADFYRSIWVLPVTVSVVSLGGLALSIFKKDTPN